MARHRYYVSAALIQGRPQAAGSVARVPGAKVEAIVVDAVRRQIGSDAPGDDMQLITTCVCRIEVRRTEIAISLASEDGDTEEDTDPHVLTVPWSKTPHRRRRDVLVPEGSSHVEVRPIRSDNRVKLVAAIARGRQWLSELKAGTLLSTASRHGRPAAGATCI
jgi:site-specific DNA recombinase